ncbi:FHF complex subunit HOOK interacting protein 1A [Erpetoichthys calabaricus]|uniref:FHF complex subunit HOOK interacting protein 1A n=1 Tax=Erpetoichthys calabaricus TaxID=27687 RepID=A0A8C4RXY8_ERPCA|nr:FHF complex subunit HOOK interacting protein 1A [Erpetoichthys calabaricus]XP_028658532.1 FHF complex subunit HOOK interacting protein 1A [Erpetoichthys calabaricus]XP_028658533.1 FHF complex subunit HOOK interacting protein 1A [Erpetoichthys calabaricus]
MTSLLTNGNRNSQALNLRGVDPETCTIVFKNHWAQVVKILEKHDPLRGNGNTAGIGVGGSSLRFGPIPIDEASAVQNYVEHMLFLMMEEECGQSGAMGPILEFVVSENVMEKLFLWSLRREFTDDMKIEQLKMYEMLVCQSRQPLLHHKPILRPLMMLLSSCSGTATPSVEAELVILLNQLCSILAKDPSILELFFHTSEDQGAANFLIFSLLIPFIHREGTVGQQARDALLFIMALSAENHVVANHVVENTYFCPVLATGLSGLYSSLPTKFEVHSEDWHCLQREDWVQVPALVQFMNSLEFCNAVIQVAHLSIRSQLIDYIYNGFLVPVVAPALHKLTVEEVMTTTAYLDLFLRNISELALLQIFLSFIFLHKHENVHILDTLVSRINTPFQLGTVSLALFRTLIGLHCEDVMLQLVLRYLIPCTHMMLSQRRVVRERDCYSMSAAKFLALTPVYSSQGLSPEFQKLTPDYILWSKNSGNEGSDEAILDLSGQEYACIVGPGKVMDIGYLQYLYEAREKISLCIKACQVWSAAYDSEDPPPECICSGSGDDRLRQSTPSHQPQMPGHHTTSDRLFPSERSQHLELEWDNSYDTGMSPDSEPGSLFSKDAPLVDPPKHIQEMRKNAIMLVKGSYIEESDFQDDFMAYKLVSQKDSLDTVDAVLSKGGSPEQQTVNTSTQRDQPVSNGLLTSLPKNEVELKNKMNSSLSQPAGTPENTKGQKPNFRQKASGGEEDDIMAQYSELLKGLGISAEGAQDAKGDSAELTMPMEEDDVDFNAFNGEQPEQEKMSPPFGTKNWAANNSSVTRDKGVPFTGPFISVLLSRLENMLDNSLHVNLLLTGIIAQLAAYPQPLLRSFLLNTNMVFQPSVRSLYQVLASVKNNIEKIAAARKDFSTLVFDAKQYLLHRDSPHSDPLGPENALWCHNGDGSRTQVRLGKQTRGALPVPTLPPTSPPLPPRIPPYMRNSVFAAVLFTEFLKELAATAQEHSILSHAPLEEE